MSKEETEVLSEDTLKVLEGNSGISKFPLYTDTPRIVTSKGKYFTYRSESLRVAKG